MRKMLTYNEGPRKDSDKLDYTTDQLVYFLLFMASTADCKVGVRVCLLSPLSHSAPGSHLALTAMYSSRPGETTSTMFLEILTRWSFLNTRPPYHGH